MTGIVLTAVLLAVTALVPSALAQPVCLEIPQVDDKCERWVVETGWGENCCGFVDNEAARYMAASEELVFLTLPVNEPGTQPFQERWDWDTVAFDASDGTERWRMRHLGPAGGWDVPLSLILSPDESIVYVTGYQDYPSNPNTIFPGGCATRFEEASALTIAYGATDGTEIWRLGDQQNPSSLNAARASALSPEGSILYTVGLVARGAPGECDYDPGVTAVDTGSGAELWTITFDEGALRAAAVTPDGSALIVGGTMAGASSAPDYFLAALDAVDDPEDPTDVPGEILWETYQPGDTESSMRSMVLSADGERVFVTGETFLPEAQGVFGHTAYDTRAYDAATGQERWRSLYTTEFKGHNVPLAIAASPQGDRVFVTGQAASQTEVTFDWGTVAYSASTGSQLWDETYQHPGTQIEEAWDLLVSPDGSRVYVTGTSGHVVAQGEGATLAYDAADGSRRWVGRLNGSPVAADFTSAFKMALSPAGDRLFVVGNTWNNVSDQMYFTGQGNDAVRGLVWSYDVGT